MTMGNSTTRAPDVNPPEKRMLIGSTWAESMGGGWRSVTSPAVRGRVLARVPEATAADVDRAVHQARKAWPSWRDQHFVARQRLLLKLADAVHDRAEDLALTTAADTGNALRTQARPEVAMLTDLLRYFGGVAGELKGVTLPTGPGQLQYTVLEPLGVVGAILPWNSPLLIAGFKVSAALAAGNTIVVKPAEDAPLPILLFAEICDEILPPGVVNVVTGAGDTAGAALVSHPGIDKVSFTGSTEVGRRIARRSGERLIPTSLELGGKSPSIVFPGDVTEDLIDGLLQAARITRQGQSCTAGSRLFLHRDVHDEVVHRLVERLASLKVGDPLDEANDVGAIINEQQFHSIQAYLDEGLRHPSLTVQVGGNPPRSGPLAEGYFHLPTLFTGAENSFRLAQEEIFGPVLVAIPWTDVDDVVRMANDSAYGLAAYIWSSDINLAVRTAGRLEAGWIQVNQGGGQFVGQSYGGYKQSGLGREVSLEGMIAGFTQTKQVNVRVAV